MITWHGDSGGGAAGVGPAPGRGAGRTTRPAGRS